MQIEQFCSSVQTSETSNQALNLVNSLHLVVTYLWTLFTRFFGLIAIWKHVYLFLNFFIHGTCTFSRATLGCMHPLPPKVQR